MGLGNGHKLPRAPRGCPCGRRGAACICNRANKVSSTGKIKPAKPRGK
jgi:hypothetical protein